jgi:hypothetical protein
VSAERGRRAEEDETEGTVNFLFFIDPATERE